MWAGFYVHFTLEDWKKINSLAKKVEKYIIFDENRLDFLIYTAGHPVRGFHPGIRVNRPCLFTLAVVSKAFENIQ